MATMIGGSDPLDCEQMSSSWAQERDGEAFAASNGGCVVMPNEAQFIEEQTQPLNGQAAIAAAISQAANHIGQQQQQQPAEASADPALYTQYGNAPMVGDSGEANPAVNDITGQVYVQADKIGLASYHFEEAGAYISYEGAPSTWTTDDSQPFPPRKHFTFASYNPETRTFLGEVDWAPTSVQGAQRWTYEMIFDETFSRIAGGRILAFAFAEDTEYTAAAAFGTEVAYNRWYDDNPYVGGRVEQAREVGTNSQITVDAFDAIDSNHRGYITKEEFLKLFAGPDRDKAIAALTARAQPNPTQSPAQPAVATARVYAASPTAGTAKAFVASARPMPAAPVVQSAGYSSSPATQPIQAYASVGARGAMLTAQAKSAPTSAAIAAAFPMPAAQPQNKAQATAKAQVVYGAPMVSQSQPPATPGARSASPAATARAPSPFATATVVRAAAQGAPQPMPSVVYGSASPAGSYVPPTGPTGPAEVKSSSYVPPLPQAPTQAPQAMSTMPTAPSQATQPMPMASIMASQIVGRIPSAAAPGNAAPPQMAGSFPMAAAQPTAMTYSAPPPGCVPSAASPAASYSAPPLPQPQVASPAASFTAPPQVASQAAPFTAQPQIASQMAPFTAQPQAASFAAQPLQRAASFNSQVVPQTASPAASYTAPPMQAQSGTALPKVPSAAQVYAAPPAAASGAASPAASFTPMPAAQAGQTAMPVSQTASPLPASRVIPGGSPFPPSASPAPTLPPATSFNAVPTAGAPTAPAPGVGTQAAASPLAQNNAIMPGDLVELTGLTTTKAFNGKRAVVVKVDPPFGIVEIRLFEDGSLQTTKASHLLKVNNGASAQFQVAAPNNFGGAPAAYAPPPQQLASPAASYTAAPIQQTASPAASYTAPVQQGASPVAPQTGQPMVLSMASPQLAQVPNAMGQQPMVVMQPTQPTPQPATTPPQPTAQAPIIMAQQPVILTQPSPTPVQPGAQVPVHGVDAKGQECALM